MRVLHCSDFHLLPRISSLAVSDWLSKRATGAFTYWWQRKRQFALTPRKLEKLAEFAARHAVDAVLCTGDFTLWGTEQEHEDGKPRHHHPPGRQRGRQDCGASAHRHEALQFLEPVEDDMKLWAGVLLVPARPEEPVWCN